MKITIGEIANQIENLKELQAIKMPVKVSYKLMRLVNKLQPEMEIYHQKRNELVKEYGTENEDKTFSVKQDKLKEFYPELKKLLEIEIDIEWQKIKIEELGDMNIEGKLLLNFI